MIFGLDLSDRIFRRGGQLAGDWGAARYLVFKFEHLRSAEEEQPWRHSSQQKRRTACCRVHCLPRRWPDRHEYSMAVLASNLPLSEFNKLMTEYENENKSVHLGWERIGIGKIEPGIIHVALIHRNFWRARYGVYKFNIMSAYHRGIEVISIIDLIAFPNHMQGPCRADGQINLRIDTVEVSLLIAPKEAKSGASWR